MPSPPAPVTSPLNKCCSPPPPPPKLQRAPEIKQPICAKLTITLSSSSSLLHCSLVEPLIHSCVTSRNSAGGARVLIATRRACAATLLVGLAVSAPAVRAEETGSSGGDEGVIGAIKSIFDPNEKTKAGKVLPKAYLKAAREVVRTLRDSLEEEDGGDIARFRRNADAAKESIREFLGGWRGQQAVAAEESYVALEKAIRSLAEFYSKAGPSAPLPQEVKNKILDDLNTAEAYL